MVCSFINYLWSQSFAISNLDNSNPIKFNSSLIIFANQSFLNEDCNFQWKRGDLIGEGAFGSVYQAMLRTGGIIAVKQIEMEESNSKKAYNSIRKEVRILRDLDHINIVKFIGTMLEGRVVHIFMELISGGSIETLLKTFGPFEEDLFQNYTRQMMEGIEYIHSKNVVHRDIKGKNVMLMANGVIKLIDFGCARQVIQQGSNSKEELLEKMYGTIHWMSPEMIREDGHGSKTDIWSCGCTVFEMVIRGVLKNSDCLFLMNFIYFFRPLVCHLGTNSNRLEPFTR